MNLKKSWGGLGMGKLGWLQKKKRTRKRKRIIKGRPQMSKDIYIYILYYIYYLFLWLEEG